MGKPRIVGSGDTYRVDDKNWQESGMPHQQELTAEDLMEQYPEQEESEDGQG